MNTSNKLTLQALQVPERAGERVMDIVVSPNNDFLGALTPDKPARLWQLSSGKPVVSPVTAPVASLAFRPGSDILPGGELAFAVGGSGNQILRYDIDLGIGLIPVFMPRASAVAYSLRGRYLACGSTDGQVRVYDLTGANQDGRAVSSSWVKGRGGKLEQKWSYGDCLLDREPRETCHVSVGRHCVTGLAFNNTHDRLFLTTTGGRLLYVDFNQPEPEARPYLKDPSTGGDFDWECLCAATHKDAALAAFGGLGNIVHLVHTDDGKAKSFVTGVGGFVRNLQFLPEGNLAVVGQLGVEVYDLATLKLVASSVGAMASLKGLTVRQFGKLVYVFGVPA